MANKSEQQQRNMDVSPLPEWPLAYWSYLGIQGYTIVTDHSCNSCRHKVVIRVPEHQNWALDQDEQHFIVKHVLGIHLCPNENTRLKFPHHTFWPTNAATSTEVFAHYVLHNARFICPICCNCIGGNGVNLWHICIATHFQLTHYAPQQGAATPRTRKRRKTNTSRHPAEIPHLLINRSNHQVIGILLASYGSSSAK